MVYDFAGIHIATEKPLDSIEKSCVKYASKAVPDQTISITENDLKYEQRFIHTNERAILENAAFCRKVAELAASFDALFMHAAVLSVAGTGIAFVAPSGTGKTTHMLNWLNVLGDRASVVNGDKPLLRSKDGVFYAYPTPWCGKEGFCGDKEVPLKAIAFITRSLKNETTKLPKSAVLSRLLSAIYISTNKETIERTLELVEKLIESCDFYEIKCDASTESAVISSRLILGI